MKSSAGLVNTTTTTKMVPTRRWHQVRAQPVRLSPTGITESVSHGSSYVRLEAAPPQIRVNQGLCPSSAAKLLTGILRDELRSEGYTVSDWYATHSTAASINAGLELEMPGMTVTGQGVSWFGERVKTAVEDGHVSMGSLDEMIRQIMTQYYLLEQDDSSFPSLDPSSLSVIASQY